MENLSLQELPIDLEYEQELTDTTQINPYCIEPLKIKVKLEKAQCL